MPMPGWGLTHQSAAGSMTEGSGVGSHRPEATLGRALRCLLFAEGTHISESLPRGVCTQETCQEPSAGSQQPSPNRAGLDRDPGAELVPLSTEDLGCHCMSRMPP